MVASLLLSVKTIAFHSIPGVREGKAEAIYNLAVIRERQKKDAEARELHLKCAGIADPAHKVWVEKSKKRLAEIPWLQEKK